MKAEIKKGTASGTVSVPPSKSCAHRLLICAALSNGTSTIDNVDFSEDILAMLDCLEALGASYKINQNTVTICGTGGKVSGEKTFPCRESGNTLRFLIPASLLSGKKSFFKGTERLISRGIEIYEEIFADKGINFTIEKNIISADGKINPGAYKVRGNVSSQFISGLFFALPLTDGDSTVEITGPVESRSYINLTLNIMSCFGVIIEKTGPEKYFIRGNQKYRPVDMSVEGDWSNAAFLYALNSLGGNLYIKGLDNNSIQGDKICVKFLGMLSEGHAEIDLSDYPDLAPVLFAVAAAKHGGKFTGTKRLKIKESDRASAMAEELRKFGAGIEIEENSVTVTPLKFEKPTETLSSHNDHRVVMSLAVLGTLTGAVIEEAEAVRKTWPDFFETLAKLGIKVTCDA